MAGVLREWVIERSLAANVGHVGSALSIVDVMAALFAGVMRYPGTDRADRDRFILGKGHAALALYAALCYTGVIDEATLRTFCAEGSLLGVHPEAALSEPKQPIVLSLDREGGTSRILGAQCLGLRDLVASGLAAPSRLVEELALELDGDLPSALDQTDGDLHGRHPSRRATD